jgi:hypothetical protein
VLWVVGCAAHKDLHNELMQKTLAEREVTLKAKLIEAEAAEQKKEEQKAAAAKAKEEAAKAKADAVCVLCFLTDRLIQRSIDGSRVCWLMYRNIGIRVVKCNARLLGRWLIRN